MAGPDVMTTLSEQWYNAVVKSLSLDDTQFQLVQGSMALGSTSGAVFQIFDAIPPLSLTQMFNPSGFNSLSANYSGVINNLVPQNDAGSLLSILGDNYVAWTTYRSNPANLPSPLPKDSSGNIDFTAAQVNMFSMWAMSNLDPATAKAALKVIQQTDVVSVAQAQLIAAGGKYAYTSTIARVLSAIASGQTKTVAFDSKQASSDTTHAWASGEVEGSYDFFSASASGSWDSFKQAIESNGVVINATFSKVATIPGQPLAVAQSTDPDLSKYTPWWNSSALNLALKNNDNLHWQHGSPSWNDTFGPDGNLLRLAAGLVIVDGINVTTTVNYSLNTTDRQNVEAAIKFGFWPFFSASGQGGWSHELTTSDESSFSVTSTVPQGNPQVLGVLVSPIGVALGNG